MNEMTQDSRNSSPGGLRSSTLSPGHGGSPHYQRFTFEHYSRSSNLSSSGIISEK